MCNIDLYMAAYLNLVTDYTPSRARKVRLLRLLIQEHHRGCKECRPPAIRSNFNAAPVKGQGHAGWTLKKGKP